jgi:hypothetical protein
MARKTVKICFELPEPPGSRVARASRTYSLRTAAANSLPVYTRNPSDFDALKSIIKIVHI